MKTAIVSVTAAGAKLGQQIAKAYDEVHVYEKEDRGSGATVHGYLHRLSQ